MLDCAQAVTPLAKALEIIQNNGDQDAMKNNVMDAFKILCLQIKATNVKRLDLIKKEMQPKYRDLCAEQPSATKLLGDGFQEAVKKLDGTKGHLTISSQNFLGRKGGDRHQSPYQYHRDQNNNYGYRKNQNYQGGKFQQKGKFNYTTNNRNPNKGKAPQSMRK